MQRSLKIEETGDFFAKRIKPLIRLRGKWLQAAGFVPGKRVDVILQNPGRLVLQATHYEHENEKEQTTQQSSVPNGQPASARVPAGGSPTMPSA